MPMKLNAQQMMALQVSERTMSVLSILGSIFIISTFVKWKYFRKPINRLVFYASFGNLMSNVATLISTDALPQRGEHVGRLCQFQGVTIQWFMMADSLWVLCMALNVMLVFFRNYNSVQLRLLEKWYLLFAYGLPFIPAFAYLMNDVLGNRIRILGPATIWCWIGPDAEYMRIAFFYGPVWVVIFFTICIYVVTGHKIFQKRAVLRSFSRRPGSEPAPVIVNPFTAANLNNIERKTDIHVVTETIDSEITAVPQAYTNESRSSFSSTRNLSNHHPGPVPAASIPSRFSRMNWQSAPRGMAEPSKEQGEVPGSGYRVTVTADHKNADLEAALPRQTPVSQAPLHVRRTAAMEGNTAAWGYFKVAFLMFAALFIVWVPSTINRLQQFVNRGHPIFALNLASALVLPLQGFWNAMVYTSTTWPECKRAFTEVMDAMSGIKKRKKNVTVHGRARKDSEHTLTSSEDYDIEIPLSQMLEQPGRPAHPRRHSRLSSHDSIKSPHLGR
ncbi:hypothetical protein P154DRAFT_205233 [Amniculicola lignicola CBS 123094]|uniref:G-protein coupled receptors family 2 profile 2 domain-containing protein n=1 Tax=Amniculicola lignicola CBS 123094 TaxID=1392246 RepID=A0A6A5WH65_9PLEO|nr:hypothetical protein P154DRAFT_205233 [Amniculicola lignicola CBS 123094]